MPYKNKQKEKAVKRRLYQQNKARYRDVHKKLQARNKEYVSSLKTECCYCGESDKIVLDFHHTRDKSFSVSELIRRAASIERLNEEVQKCEVVCGNCHQKQHVPKVITDGSSWKGFPKCRIQKRRWFIDFLAGSKCRCGESDPRCLEFHHVGKKRYKISYLLTSGHSLAYLQEEIAKCVVLCTNCHRKEHFRYS